MTQSKDRPNIDPSFVRGLTQPRYSRRQFLRNAGMGAGAVGLGAFLAACGTKGVTTSNTGQQPNAGLGTADGLGAGEAEGAGDCASAAPPNATMESATTAARKVLIRFISGILHPPHLAAACPGPRPPEWCHFLTRKVRFRPMTDASYAPAY